MNSKIRIFSALLAFIMIFSVAFVGCSDNDENSNDDNSKELHIPRPQPIETLTLKALQASIPENSPITKHNLEFQIPETLDKEYDDEAYFNYRVKYNLDDYKMADAVLDEKVNELYEGAANVWFVHTGDEVFQISENSWGIIKTVKVKAFIDGGIVDETVTFVLTGLEEKK